RGCVHGRDRRGHTTRHLRRADRRILVRRSRADPAAGAARRARRTARCRAAADQPAGRAMTLRFREHRAAWLILAAYVVLATTYSVVTPVFEGPDEFLHAGVVHYIAETGQVPVQQPGVRTAWDQEG